MNNDQGNFFPPFHFFFPFFLPAGAQALRKNRGAGRMAEDGCSVPVHYWGQYQ